MLLSIVTLNYKKSHLTIACMASLYKEFSKEFERDEMELFVVDNASGDDSVEKLEKELEQKKYKNFHLIANELNSGFGAGCNLGTKKSKGKYILFLNNDTVVQDMGLWEMAQYLETHSDIAILGGQLRNHDGSLQPSTGKFYTLKHAVGLFLGMQRLGFMDKNPTDIAKVDWVKGALFMVRADVFRRLQGFDEKIFMYTEDMELCYRAKLAGEKVYFYPKVTVIHEDQGSSNRSFAIVNIYKNLLYFYKKHRSRQEYLFLKTLLRTKAVTLIGVGKLLRKPYFTETYEKALKVT